MRGVGRGAGFGEVEWIENQVSFFAETYCSSSASEDKILCESFWLKEFVFYTNQTKFVILTLWPSRKKLYLLKHSKNKKTVKVVWMKILVLKCNVF